MERASTCWAWLSGNLKRRGMSLKNRVAMMELTSPLQQILIATKVAKRCSSPEKALETDEI